MSRYVVSAENVDKAISENLKIYGETIEKGVAKEAEKYAKQLVKDTKATAPVGHRSKHYRDSIKYKRFVSPRRVKFIWYVDGSNYRLSHLLENGHANRDGGRTPGTHFIQNASEPILEAYLKAVEEVIKNG